MFKSKTVFVVGAGASAEAGMPIGKTLTSDIAEILRCEGSGRRRHVANSYIQQAIETKITSQGQPLDTTLPNYFVAIDHIIKNMPLASSIDAYLHT
jgi:hypothetical protein